MYTNILIPVVFDDDKEYRTAIEVARKLGTEDARITFLHVIESLPAYASDYVPAAALEEGRAAIRTKLSAIAADVPGAQTALVDGSAGRGITGWAEETMVDCIIVASHQPAFADVFLGSTAAWVVRNAGCAVHVLR